MVYDVIVIGAGHAGCEAAAAASRLGCKTLVLTLNLDTIGLMPCNPSIGGPAKGQIVGEVDALGGLMGLAADQTFIQMKILNRSRGPAVQCLRSQNDKYHYNQWMKKTMMGLPGLDIRQDAVLELLTQGDEIRGIKTQTGKVFEAKTVVVTTGTFLKGKIHVGLHNFSAGRAGEFSSEGLSDSLAKLGLRLGRLKTGTTPRLDARSIDVSRMTVQPGDPEFLHFSFKTRPNEGFKNQVECYLTHTTPETHRVILDNLDKSPMYQKVIKGVGPRYCPSIEDKVVRFCDKDGHQVFIEPEGRDTVEIYAQGLNTSLPEEVQEAFLKTIPGLESVKVLKWGYAVEYDFVYPDQLLPTLETRAIKGLFCAGQINGTSGYEEAAGQGIVAGINAGLSSQKKPPFVVKREEAYIGTMIDDLITKAIYEPYRMLTSRSEYRLWLRQDNAIFRLGERAYDIGLLSLEEITFIRGEKASVETFLSTWGREKISVQGEKTTVQAFLKRPNSTVEDLVTTGLLADESRENAARAMVTIKYEGYVQKQQKEIAKMQAFENRILPEDIPYETILGLRNESREKLKKFRPKTMFEAKHIAGINPADLMILVAYLERGKRRESVAIV